MGSHKKVLIPLRVNCLFGYDEDPVGRLGQEVLIPLRVNCLFGWLSSLHDCQPTEGLNPSQGQLPLRMQSQQSVFTGGLKVLIPLRVNCLFGSAALVLLEPNLSRLNPSQGQLPLRMKKGEQSEAVFGLS